MLSVVANIPVKADAASCAKFEELFAIGAKRVQSTEPGCLLYQLAKHPKKAGAYTVIELYANKEAFKAHVKGLQANPSPPEMESLRDGITGVKVLNVFGPPGLKAGSPALAIVAELKLKPDGGPGFQEASMQVISDVQSKEDGNLLYCFATDPKDPTSVVVTELYMDMAAIQVSDQIPVPCI
jgi:quinol monooxygenase YgiN